MARCICDDGDFTICTRRCGHCSGCLGCSINRENGRCNCTSLKPDCKHAAFNPSFPECLCDDGETTCCTRRCGHCGGCLDCRINRESGRCNCTSLKPDCKHAAFNPSFPECRCDDGETTVCTRLCGHCGGCLGCSINRESGRCNCISLEPDCEHAPFNPSFPDCACDDGEFADCFLLCGHCRGCLGCSINRESGSCNYTSLRPDCTHAAFNPDCYCHDGESTSCVVVCDSCHGCLDCGVIQSTGECNCHNLEPDCEHTSVYNKDLTVSRENLDPNVDDGR